MRRSRKMNYNKSHLPSNNISAQVNDYRKENASSPVKKNEPNIELRYFIYFRINTTKKHIEKITKNKYQNNGLGITFHDLMNNFKDSKEKAQRTLKYFHKVEFLFTAEDLQEQGIYLKGFKRSRPQRYYLTQMKSKIIEDNHNNNKTICH
jgi:hypothetical protein